MGFNPTTSHKAPKSSTLGFHRTLTFIVEHISIIEISNRQPFLPIARFLFVRLFVDN
jgi:hypothetical protein